MMYRVFICVFACDWICMLSNQWWMTLKKHTVWIVRGLKGGFIWPHINCKFDKAASMLDLAPVLFSPGGEVFESKSGETKISYK